ncbi:MAG: XrtA/PEP-CTERM system TPR-repeat protein PrsT, partial [Burkholderiales bacterium]
MSTRAVLAGLLAAYLTSAAAATPQKAAGFYEDALRRFERQDTPGAIIQLKNALQQDRRMLPAHLLLGKALLKHGDLKGAEAAFEEALNQGVDRSEVVLPLGQIYIAVGRPEFVIDRIQATGLPTALQVEVLSMRGTAYIELGKTRLASQSFEDARALDPKSVTPLIAEIPMLLSLDQADRAKAFAAKAIDIAPNSGAAWNMHASVLHAALDLAGAIAAYDRALSLQPDLVDARVARAGLLIDLRRYADAEKDLDFLRKSAPSEPRAAYLRAVIAGYKGDEAAIGAALRDVVKLIDALPLAWLSSREQLLMVGALSHHGLGNWEKAREYLNVIIARNGQSVAAKKLLASIYVETKDYARALSQLEPMYKAMPEDPQVLFLLGSVHLAQRRYVTATEMLEKAAARSGSSSMNRTLAFSQLELGRRELGLSTLEKVFAANPGDVQAGTTLSMLYMRMGESQKALEVATAMAKRDSGNLTALNFLGATKAATGDAAGARSAYAEILAKQPGFRPAVLNLARLDVSEGRIDEARRRLSDV